MSRKPTVAAQLATRLGGEWKAVRGPGEFSWHWVGPGGRVVRKYAELVLGIDGYSDTEFAIVFIDDDGHTVGRWLGGLIL